MTTTTQDLRTKIDELESKQVILAAERDDLALEAVTGNKKAAVRVAEINDELVRLTHEAATLAAALKTAVAREREAEASKLAHQKRTDMAKAEAMLPEVEMLAQQMDAAMQTLHEVATAFDKAWATIRRLSGGGPNQRALIVHLGRAFRVGLRGLPGVEADLVAPLERHSAAELAAGWSLQVRNLAAQENQTKPAKAAA
jgi:hypothetical protein